MVPSLMEGSDVDEAWACKQSKKARGQKIIGMTEDGMEYMSFYPTWNGHISLEIFGHREVSKPEHKIGSTIDLPLPNTFLWFNQQQKITRMQ